ncbi:MAG: NAD-dependent dehydratase, partial [Candidatus Thiodiazotropha sp.]
NLGVGDGPSIGELVERIGKLLGKELIVEQDPARIRPANSEVMRLISNNEKARALMDWQPQVSLDDGLSEVIKFIEANLAQFKVGIYNI